MKISSSLVLLCVVGEIAAQVPSGIGVDSSAADAASVLAPLVVTGSRTPLTVDGAAAVVIHPESLDVPPAPTLDLALRELPFVLVRQNSRGETELSLRGSESRQAAVLLDGIPLTLGWDHRTDPSLVPLTGVQRLVLVRGLSSLLHGPNVLGGIVEADVARGAPGADPRPGLAVATGVGEGGARAATATATASIATGAATIVLRGGAGHRARDALPLSGGLSDVAGNGGRRANSDAVQTDGFIAARWQSSAGRYLSVTATGYDAERGVPPELHVASPRWWRYPSIRRGLAILSAGTGPAETPLGLGSLELAAGVNRGRTEIEIFDDPMYRSPVGHERGEERTLTARLHGRHSLPGYGELRGALTGAEVRYDEHLARVASPNRYRQRLWSTGLEAEWPIGGDALVSGGLVYDWANTPETGGRTQLGRLDAWGWRLGATTTPMGDAVRLHGSISRRARFPALRELYSEAIDRFEPNPSLRPERLLGTELGATAASRLGPGDLSLQAVVFHHRLGNAIVREPAGEGRFHRVNRDAMRSTGMELLAGWSSEAGLSVTSDVLLQRVRLEDPSGDRRPEHQPEARGRFGVEAPLGLGLRLLADARYVGRQYCVHPDLETTVALNGQAEGDVGLTKTWALRGGAGVGSGLLKSLRAMIGLDNVTDATVYDQCGLPRPGRTLRLAIQLR